MVNALWVVAALAAGGAVEMSGNADPIAWPRATGYLAASNTNLSYKVDGPGALMLELRAQGRKPTQVQIVLLRDGRFRSTNAVKLRAKSGGPKGYGTFGKLALPLSAGPHEVIIQVERQLAVAASWSKHAPKSVAAAVEVEDAAPPEPEPEPAATGKRAALEPNPGSTSAPNPAPEPQAASAPAQVEAGPEAVAELADAKATPSASPAHAADARTGLNAALRVAVYDFELQGIDPNIGAVVTDSMLAEVRKLQGISAIGMDEIRDMLSHEANKQILGCESNESCLAEIAGALGVDNLISGQLGKVDDGVVFVARRIDQQRAKVIGVVNKRLQASSGEEFLAAIGPAVEELFPNHNLREGAERGVPKEMALRLNPPPLPTWSFWSVGGGALAAAAAGGVFGLLALNHEDTFHRLRKQSLSTTIEGSELTRAGRLASTNADYANYSFIGAGALAISAGVIALFVDWHGYSGLQ